MDSSSYPRRSWSRTATRAADAESGRSTFGKTSRTCYGRVRVCLTNALTGWDPATRSCAIYEVCRWRRSPLQSRPVCWAWMTGRGAKASATAPSCVIWSRTEWWIFYPDRQSNTLTECCATMPRRK